MLCKFHHGLTDGVGGVQIAMTIFDLSEEPRSMETVATKVEDPEVHEHGLLSEYAEIVRYDVDLLRKAVRG